MFKEQFLLHKENMYVQLQKLLAEEKKLNIFAKQGIH